VPLIPCSARTLAAIGSIGWPSSAVTPALATSMPGSERRRRRTHSAIGLRQTLPAQTIRIFLNRAIRQPVVKSVRGRLATVRSQFKKTLPAELRHASKGKLLKTALTVLRCSYLETMAAVMPALIAGSSRLKTLLNRTNPLPSR
jgi:hypothetical protein